MKICPVGADFFHTDRETDMSKLAVTFRNFENAPRNDKASHSMDHSPHLEKSTITEMVQKFTA